MTTHTILSFFLLAGFVSCTNDRANQLAKAGLKITIEVVPEGDSSYSISWKDTMGQSNGYTISNRPFEVWCIIRDTKGIVGHYQGLSMPADFTYFSTTDSLITAGFMIGPNFFSDKIPEEERKKMYQGPEKVMAFRPIQLDIKNNLRKKLAFVLEEK